MYPMKAVIFLQAAAQSSPPGTLTAQLVLMLPNSLSTCRLPRVQTELPAVDVVQDRAPFGVWIA
jgi:hypothetical protein